MIVKPQNLFIGLCKNVHILEFGRNIRSWRRFKGYPQPIEELLPREWPEFISIERGELWQITEIKMERVK